MSFMKRPGRLSSFSRAVIGIALLALLSSLQAQAKNWDPEGASQAFQDAERMRAEMSKASAPSLNQLLECAKTYSKVHARDPHYSQAGEAIYREGVIYEEMGDKFGDVAFYKTALKRFQLLIHDYAGNRNSADALLRIGDIYLNTLKDPDEAEKAYRLLKTDYGSSPAARQLANRKTVPVQRPSLPPLPAAEKNAKSDKPATARNASIQNIRHWSTSEYTRVIVDLDAAASYSEHALANPDRIYFDIANARLNSDLHARTISVNDSLLQQIRVSQNGPETVRVVLDLARQGNLAVSEMQDPFRIVIDLRQSDSPKAPPNTQVEKKTIPRIPAAESQVAANRKPSSPEAKAAQTVEIKVSRPIVRPPPKAITEVQSDLTQNQAPPSETPQAAAADTTLPAAAKPAVDKTGQAPAKAPNHVDPPKIADSPVSSPPTPTSENKAKSPETAKAAEASLPQTSRPADPTSLGDRTLTRTLGLKIGRIVIDPGHGGHDLGTTGPGGLLEKDLVLAIAMDLKALLEQKLGAQVILTRYDDTFISLEQRAEIANDFHADLFVSIHANSSRSRYTSGVETYYLNFAKTNAEREIASRENATSASNISELEDLIKKIAQADKSTESRELATMIQKNLYSGARKIFPKVQNRGVRSAPFIVLIGANMPSALTEVAFISNPGDEKLLKKSSNQERMVKALFAGIEGYMKTLGCDMAQNRPTN